MNKTPAVRFKGFTEDWEQRKFGDYGSIAMCRRIFKHQTSDAGEIPFFKIGTFGNTPDAFISKELFEEFKAMYPYPEKGDILISASGSIGRTVEFKGKDEYYQDSNIVWLKHDKRITNPFLCHLYSVVKWDGVEGSTIKRLYNDIFLNTEIIIPSVSEQDQIATTLDNIDDLITFQQCKYEKLVNIKKSMLYKMFPQNGSKVPEIRFAGFTDDWEQQAFEKAFDYLQNNTLSRAELNIENGVAKNVHYGDVLIKFGEYLDISNSVLPYITSQQVTNRFRSSLLKNGDVVMADTAEDETVGKCTELAGISHYPIISGLHTIPLRPKIRFAAGYLGYYMNSSRYHNQLLPLIQGTKVSSISKNALKNTSILFPSKTYEQRLIGQYFIQLDNLILFHHRKLEKLKQIKQAMLHKMFV